MEKIVIITGATSGIGRELKHRFEKDGSIVYALSLENLDNESNFIKCNITNETEINSAIEYIVQKHGKIDVLVNNAGYGLFGAAEILPTEQVEKQMDTNFLGAYMMSKECLKYMQKGAKIINISSACALFPLPYRSMYCVSKAAVSTFTDCLKMELKPLNIDVTAICPGDIKTPFIKNKVKIIETNEKYQDRIQNACDYVDSKNDKRMTIDYAVGKIYKIANKCKLKPMYIIGGKYKMLYFLTRFAPKSWYLNIVEKHFGGHKKLKKD